jgi:hypothetical protein
MVSDVKLKKWKALKKRGDVAVIQAGLQKFKKDNPIILVGTTYPYVLNAINHGTCNGIEEKIIDDYFTNRENYEKKLIRDYKRNIEFLQTNKE